MKSKFTHLYLITIKETINTVMSGKSDARERAMNFRRVYDIADGLGMKYPEVVAAQWAQETGHGKSTLATKHNNLFGQKGKGVNMQTHEFDAAGNRSDMPDDFMTFESPTSSVTFLRDKWYRDNDEWGQGLMNKGGGTREGLMQALEDDYATDPHYAEHLQSQLDRYYPGGKFSDLAGDPLPNMTTPSAPAPQPAQPQGQLGVTEPTPPASTRPTVRNQSLYAPGEPPLHRF